MAELYKPGPIQDAPDWMKLVKPLNLSAFTASKVSGTGAALRGAANVLDQTTTAIKNAYDIGIENTLKPDLQKIQNSFGPDYVSKGGPNIFNTGDARAEASDDDVTAATNSPGLPDAFAPKAKKAANVKGAPPGTETVTSDLPDYQAAFQAGNLTPTHYWMLMNARVAQAKAMYPGFTDKVDQVASQVTGGRPADELRKAMLAEAEAKARAGSDASDKRQQYILSNAEQLREAWGENWTARAKGASLEELASTVSNVKYHYAAIEHETQRLNLLKSRGVDVHDEAVQNAEDHAQYITDRDGSQFFGTGEWKDALKNSPGGNITAEQRQALGSKFSEMRQTGLLQFNQAMQQYRRQGVSGEEIEKFRQRYVASWKEREDAIANKDYGMLHATEAFNNARLQDTNHYLDTHVPEFTTGAAIQKAFPQAGFMEVVNATNGKLLTHLADATRLATAARAQLQPGASSAAGDIKEFQKTGAYNATPDANNAMVNTYIRPLLSPSFSEEQKQNAVRHIYANDGMNGVHMLDLPKPNTLEKRIGMWGKLTDPRLISEVYKTVQSNPELQMKVDEWIKNSFTSLFAGQAKDVELWTQPGNATREMKFDPKSFQITVAEPEKGGANLRGRALAGSPVTAQDRTVSQFNQALLSLKPWVEKTGQNPDEYMRHLLQDYMGVSLEKKTPGNPFQSILDNLPTSEEKPGENTKPKPQPKKAGSRY